MPELSICIVRHTTIRGNDVPSLLMGRSAGKRQSQSYRSQIIRIHVSLLGMLSKVLNDLVFDLVRAKAPPSTNDMHAFEYFTHTRDVTKAIRLFRGIARIVATIEQGIACIVGRESACGRRTD
jgi:hypothetical protein